MYVYELAVLTGERSTDLVERARLLGIDVQPGTRLTQEQLEMLQGGTGAAASFVAPEVPGPVEAPKTRTPMTKVLALIALPVIAISGGLVYKMTQNQTKVEDAAPPSERIGSSAESLKVSGDAYGVSDPLAFCDAAGRLIVLGEDVTDKPSAAQLRTTYLGQETAIRTLLAKIVGSTEGTTRKTAGEYRLRYTALIEQVRMLPPSERYFADLSPQERHGIEDAVAKLTAVDLGPLDAAKAAHC